jgi:hypothetical protein
MIPTADEVSYLVETNTNFFKVKVPAHYTLSYAPIRGGDSTMALRVRDGQHMVGIFMNVVQFRKADLQIEVGEYNQATHEISWTPIPLVQMAPVDSVKR